MAEDKEFQLLARQRAVRARHKHNNPVGFDTDVVCWVEDDEGVRCEFVPEFHIEQLDGDCYMSCRAHATKLVTEIPIIPLEQYGTKQN